MDDKSLVSFCIHSVTSNVFGGYSAQCLRHANVPGSRTPSIASRVALVKEPTKLWMSSHIFVLMRTVVDLFQSEGKIQRRYLIVKQRSPRDLRRLWRSSYIIPLIF